mmetsp:Transcript_15454/g.52407  ORF Transcript_15454/g.52407 Transcript_15454/m.52407 type:complete len:82 (+) Transcript_15454:230-475(+)
MEGPPGGLLFDCLGKPFGESISSVSFEAIVGGGEVSRMAGVGGCGLCWLRTVPRAPTVFAVVYTMPSTMPKTARFKSIMGP